ncbi:MAG: F0F1 ATP synthase subunit B [Candidatus Eisenbacteria bacterium]|uniref:ATP synthase subunit b n=1 Tax=Eiseniibacteriota bacterium TaxID=2212470 RepID=A0A849SC03_UNCEI|nr:F0F1 ATP synthase subunit B [Candidatus Eisenbacteria bacterium]
MNGLIDLKLVLTQALGFIVMVWVLSRYAWKPLLAILDKRRADIAAEFGEAERRQAAAEALKARYEGELRGIEAQARQRLQDAVAEGNKVAGEIRSQAQTEAASRLERAQDDISRERERAKEILKEQTISLAMRAAEKILRSKLDEPTHRKLAGDFIDEVGARQ